MSMFLVVLGSFIIDEHVILGEPLQQDWSKMLPHLHIWHVHKTHMPLQHLQGLRDWHLNACCSYLATSSLSKSARPYWLDPFTSPAVVLILIVILALPAEFSSIQLICSADFSLAELAVHIWHEIGLLRCFNW